MDVQGIMPSFYRYNLDASLRDPVTIPPVKQDYAFIDMVMGVKPIASSVRAPQDIGEAKHSLVDEKSELPEEENTVAVRTIEETARSVTANQAHKYRSFSRLNILESRRNMEAIVRKIKRIGSECPYTGDSRQCTKVFIRCGERAQFSLRETTAQQILPHTCRYAPAARGENVLIVDSDPRVREFCKQTMALFLDHDHTTITTTDSPSEAIEMLNRSKLAGRRFGLFIVDASLPGNGGYWLVNELFGRNHDVNIILTRNGQSPKKPPKDYAGNFELAPKNRFVSVVLSKPFHSDELVSALKKLGY